MKRFGVAVLWVGLIVCLIIAAVVALSYVMPWRTETSCRCPYCGARAMKVTVLVMPMSMQVTEGPLSRYWLRNVDARHEHEWVTFVRRFYHSGGVGLADCSTGSPGRWLLSDEQLVAILSGLPTSSERRAFMDWLWESGKGKDMRQVLNAALGLRAAYDKDPTRTDWPSVLRKHGCYPAAGGKP